MATCKDCIYENKCISRISHFMDIDESTGKEITDIEKRCTDFKNKSDVAEVVRCKDSKRAKPLMFRRFYKCHRHNACRKAENFCSYGERRGT